MVSIRGRDGIVLRHRGRTADERALQRAVRAGTMIRLRSGAYVESDAWATLNNDERRRLEVAAAADRNAAFVASHRSAAALWGVPTIRAHDGNVHARVSVAAGTRTEHGVRKHAVRDLDLHRAIVEGIPCTTIERTILDLAATEPFDEAVVAADWALREHVTKEGLRKSLDEWNPSRGRRRVEAVIDFADPASGSVGESWSRVQIHEGGLPAPVLQQVFSDGLGLIGYVDFWWPELNRIGEFDGLMKYREAEMLRGRAPGDVVALEKVREDRLRATRTRPDVSRWTWSALADHSLARRLRAAGVRNSA